MYLFIKRDPTDGERFSNFKLFHGGKKFKILNFDTEYSHIFNNKSRKLSPSVVSPYQYKKLENIIFQLNIAHFSEHLKIVKNILTDVHYKTAAELFVGARILRTF